MANKQRWNKQHLRIIGLVLGALVLIAALILASGHKPLPALDDMGIAIPATVRLPVVEGEPWRSGQLDRSGFAEVAANNRFRLLLEPGSSQIALQDLQSGFLWRSNPAAEEADSTGLRGQQLSNLKSPFILEYTMDGKIQRNIVNALEKSPQIHYAQLPNGIQAAYEYEELGLQIVIQYQLSEEGLIASIPTDGIREDGNSQLISIHLLPYFGAVQGTAEEGYLFVPDGPGGLIRYDSPLPRNIRYDFPIYGDELANAKEAAVERESVAYPVFGLKRGDHAYAAIVEHGKYTTWIKGQPAASDAHYHALGASFVYREEYNRKVSRIAPPVKSIQQRRVDQDRRVEYRFLNGEDANYSGMASAYRAYLEENGQLGGRLEPVPELPLVLSIVGGAMKQEYGRTQFKTATTFAQATEIGRQLQESGIKRLRMIYEGWLSGGQGTAAQEIAVEAKLGGKQGAQQFIRRMQAYGYQVLFQADLSLLNPDIGSYSAKADGIRSVDATTYFDKEGQILLHPALAVRSSKPIIDYLSSLGADGVHYRREAGTVYRDYNPAQPMEREHTASLHQALLSYSKQQLGGVIAGTRANDYALQALDLMVDMPMEGSYDFLIDETVPFYPMAVHGYMEYTMGPGNLRNEYGRQLLKAIEYGALPYFKITEEPSRELIGTAYEDLFSSQFSTWQDQIASEYSQFKPLSAVYHLPMIAHHHLSDGVYATVYEDGTQVQVDYNRMAFEVIEGGAE